MEITIVEKYVVIVRRSNPADFEIMPELYATEADARTEAQRLLGWIQMITVETAAVTVPTVGKPFKLDAVKFAEQRFPKAQSRHRTQDAGLFAEVRQ